MTHKGSTANHTCDDGYNTVEWFTPKEDAMFEFGSTRRGVGNTNRSSRNDDDDDDNHFQSIVCNIKNSAKWIQRNGLFESSKTSDGQSESSIASSLEALCGAHIDVYWDQGAAGWYTAKVISVKRQPYDKRNNATLLLTIVYDDGERDDAFDLHEWLWSVSARSSDWLKEYQSKTQQQQQKEKDRKRKRLARVLCSDSENEDKVLYHEDDNKKVAETDCGSEHDSSVSTEEDTFDCGTMDKGYGVLKYDDALRFCDYEHDQRCDPLYTSVGGMAFHICNDRWRHAFYHIPNSNFAKDILRICSGPLLPGITERRVRCKLCARGSCRRHGRGARVSGSSGSFPKSEDNARCVMCNRKRSCVYVQLGALSEKWLPMGSCCLRKLDAMILLYKALENVKELRHNPVIVQSNIETNCQNYHALEAERTQAVRKAVDAFNRAVDEFDDAMGMDMKYNRFGSMGSGFYRRYDDRHIFGHGHNNMNRGVHKKLRRHKDLQNVDWD